MSNKAALPAGSAEKIFIESIKRIQTMGETEKINAAVDVGVVFSSVMIDEKGSFIALFKGRDTKQQSIELKLATRIYLSAPSGTGN